MFYSLSNSDKSLICSIEHYEIMYICNLLTMEHMNVLLDEDSKNLIYDLNKKLTFFLEESEYLYGKQNKN